MRELWQLQKENVKTTQDECAAGQLDLQWLTTGQSSIGHAQTSWQSDTEGDSDNLEMDDYMAIFGSCTDVFTKNLWCRPELCPLQVFFW